MSGLNVLVIKVDYDKQTKSIWLSKGTPGDDYKIRNGHDIYLSHPTCFDLQFEANVEIQGICFLPRFLGGLQPIKWNQKGPCTGSGAEGPFFLRCDFAPGSKKTPRIQNTGENPPGGFQFFLWIEDQPARCLDRSDCIVDPQIYNHGEPPPGEWWRRLWLGFFGRFLRSIGRLFLKGRR